MSSQILLPHRLNSQVPYEKDLKVSITSLVSTYYEKSYYVHTEDVEKREAIETVLGFFGFDRPAYSNFKRNNGGRGRRKWLWYEELREQRIRDIETEILGCR